MAPNKIVIVDYKSGNLKSVANALQFLGFDSLITDRPSDVKEAKVIVLPGVGAFGKAMDNLRDFKLIDVLNEKVLKEKVPFLGICLGMQLVAESSEEKGNFKGLGWIPGKVKHFKIDSSMRVPHVGWNNTQVTKKTPLFDNIEDGSTYYYVHSYYLECEEEYVAARCSYGLNFVSAIQKENIFATQFHPEKSQHNGLKLLRNFTNFVKMRYS